MLEWNVFCRQDNKRSTRKKNRIFIFHKKQKCGQLSISVDELLKTLKLYNQMCCNEVDKMLLEILLNKRSHLEHISQGFSCSLKAKQTTIAVFSL